MKNNLWFSSYYGVYEGKEKVFYTSSEMAIAAELEKDYPILKNELQILWNNADNSLMDDYGNYSSFDDKQFPPQSWKKIVFKVWGLRNKAICEKFPATTSFFEKFHGVTSCFVTKATAGSIIKSHCGETNAHYRVHLGLHVPSSTVDECGMEVKGEKMSWENGKSFGFLDAYHHHVWNRTYKDRYVLIIDVLRPEFLHQQNFICARTIVNQAYFFVVYKLGWKFLYKTPAWVVTALGFIFKYPVMLAISLSNKFGLAKL